VLKQFTSAEYVGKLLNCFMMPAALNFHKWPLKTN